MNQYYLWEIYLLISVMGIRIKKNDGIASMGFALP